MKQKQPNLYPDIQLTLVSRVWLSFLSNPNNIIGVYVMTIFYHTIGGGNAGRNGRPWNAQENDSNIIIKTRGWYL